MIAGIGTDIAAIGRFENMLRRHGEALLHKILAPEETDLFLKRFGRVCETTQGYLAQDDRSRRLGAAFLAKRFAAKEALVKALGTGFRAPCFLPEIAVQNDESGRPFFSYAPALAEWLTSRQVTAHLSLSDERDYAVAFVLLEKTS